MGHTEFYRVALDVTLLGPSSTGHPIGDMEHPIGDMGHPTGDMGYGTSYTGYGI